MADQRLKLDERGRLFVVDELEKVLDTGTSGSPTSSGQLQPYDQTFRLHSKLGANRTVYLDFNGATLTGTAWNDSTGIATINAQPFDLDGLPYSFSTTELERIQYIWQRVAEDFAAFDVDVTTEEPPPDALTRSSSTDAIYGTTALITYRALLLIPFKTGGFPVKHQFFDFWGFDRTEKQNGSRSPRYLIADGGSLYG